MGHGTPLWAPFDCPLRRTLRMTGIVGSLDRLRMSGVGGRRFLLWGEVGLIALPNALMTTQNSAGVELRSHP